MKTKVWIGWSLSSQRIFEVLIPYTSEWFFTWKMCLCRCLRVLKWVMLRVHLTFFEDRKEWKVERMRSRLKSQIDAQIHRDGNRDVWRSKGSKTVATFDIRTLGMILRENAFAFLNSAVSARCLYHGLLIIIFILSPLLSFLRSCNRCIVNNPGNTSVYLKLWFTGHNIFHHSLIRKGIVFIHFIL